MGMTEPSERDREMVQSYLGDFLDYGNRMWPPTWRRATNAALMLVAAAREEGRRAAIEECTRLREALEPFAQRAEYLNARLKANGSAWRDEDGYVDDPPSDIYLKHLRDARRALAKP